MADTESSQSTDHAWWDSLWEFLIHVVVGTGIFALIGTPAVVLDVLVSWLSTKSISSFIIYGLKSCEYTLFIVDIALFIVFIVRTAWRTFRKL